MLFRLKKRTAVS
jgi:hypothetical protein